MWRAKASRSGSTSREPMTAADRTAIEIELVAAIVAVDGDEPMILMAGDGAILTGLPSGRFDPLAHHTFEIGLRAWVKAQTGLSVGYVEQLYTFGDRGRHSRPGDRGPHAVSVGYLALTRLPDSAAPRSTAGPATRRATIHPVRSAGANACANVSPPAEAHGTRRRCSTATSCSTKPGWSRRRATTAARPRSSARTCPPWASRCGTTIAVSWRPPSRGCAPSSNTVR